MTVRMKKHHPDLLKNKLKEVLNNARKVESEVWVLVNKRDHKQIPQMLKELKGLVLLAAYELRKIEDVEHFLISVKKTPLAVEIERDLYLLEQLIDEQLRRLSTIDALSPKEIVEILDGEKRGGEFSESSQLIQKLIKKIEKE